MKYRLFFVWLWLCGIGSLGYVAYAQFLINPYLVTTGGDPPYSLTGATFASASSVYLDRSSIEGAGTSDNFAMSFWYKATSDDAWIKRIMWSNADKFVISHNTSVGAIDVRVEDSGGTEIISITSSVTLGVADGWVHVMIIGDSTATGDCSIWFDGTEDTSASITVNGSGNIDWAGITDLRIGRETAANYMNSELSELWLDDDRTGIAVTDFRTAGGDPVDLGTNGENPNSSAPMLYLSNVGSADSWANDSSGNDNDFTVNNGPLGTPNPLPPGGFTPFTAGFNGTSQYLTADENNPALLGASSGNDVTISVWLNPTGGDGNLQHVIWGSNDRTTIQKDTTNRFRVIWKSPGGSDRIDYTSTTTKTATDGWFHLLVVLGDTTGETKMYFDGTLDTPLTETVTSGELNKGTGEFFRVGGASSGLNKWVGSMTELYIQEALVDDVTKFESGGVPISLGPTGNLPDGSSALLYLSLEGEGDTWGEDSSGNANDFTVSGSPLGTPTAP